MAYIPFLHNAYFTAKVGIGTESPGYTLTTYASTTGSNIVASFGSGLDSNDFTAIGLSGFIASNGATKAGIALKRRGVYGTGELHFLNNTTLDNSDMTLSDSKMMINQDGNLGIGTTTPSSIVSTSGSNTVVYDASSVNGQDSTSTIKIANRSTNANTFASIDFNTNNNRVTNRIVSSHAGTVHTGFLAFVTESYDGTSGVPSEKMRITGTGNVGIGTADPGFALDVHGDSTAGVLSVKNAANGRDTFRSENAAGTRTVNIGNDGSGHGNILIRNSSGTTTNYISGSGNSYFNGGNVGIGTTSPLDPLNVQSTGASDYAFRIFRSTSTTQGLAGFYEGSANQGQLYLLKGDNTAGVFLNSNGNSYLNGGNVGIGATTGFNAVSGTETTLYIKNTNVASLYLDSTANNGNKWGIYSAAAGQLAFYDFSDGSERMRITGTGDVGINTTSPDFKLDVDGTFGVSNLPFNSSSVSVLVADEITGAELVTNGSFANGSTDWSGNFSIASGVASYDATSQKNLFQSETLTNGLTYKLKFTISNTTGTGGRIWFGNSGGSVNYFGGSYVYYVNGTYEKVFTMPSTQTSFCFFALGNGTPAGQAFDISGISIKQVTSASNQIQKRELGTGAFGPTPVGAYLPLAGGTMTGTNGVIFPDNFNLKIGTGSDLKIFHNATDSFIINEVGNLKITQGANDKDIIFESDNGSGGTTPYLTLDGSITKMVASKDIHFDGTVKATFGSNADPLEIYHDGSNSYIKDLATGTLNIQGSTQVLIGGINGEVGVQYVENAGVGLRHNNVAKLTTESTGVAVVGNITVDSALLSNQENTDIDTGAEVVAQVAHATYTAAFFDFVVKKGTNVRSGTVYACHNGDTTPLVEFTETSTQDLGDTSDVVLSVDISSTQMRLLATVTSDDWSVKSLIRAI